MKPRSFSSAAQLSWIAGRFGEADAPTWVSPDDAEMRVHFDEHMLAAVPAPELVRQITSAAVQLRAEMVVIGADKDHARARLAGLEVVVGVASDPPHRIVGLNSTVPDSRITDIRVASQSTRISGHHHRGVDHHHPAPG